MSDRLLEDICRILDAPAGLNAAVIGVGNIGRSLISYFSGRSSKINIVAAFDNDPAKVGRVIAGCRCFDSVELRTRVRELGISLGIITVPAERAQATADALADAGVTGIVNFAPVPLRVRPEVFVEQVDIMRSLEKAAHFAKQQQSKKD
jgi:redox-sensing transcriptional repressor